MRRLRLLSILLVAPIVAVSACGGDKDEKKLPPIESAAPAPSAEPTALPTTQEEAKKLHIAVLGKNAARTDEEKAAVAVYMDYWEAVTDSYYEAEVAPALSRTSRDKAAIIVLNYVAELKTKKQREVGWTRNNVLDIEVTEDKAVIRDCIENFSFTVDSKGKPLEEPTPFYLSKGTLVLQKGTWVVTGSKATVSKSSCL